MADPPDYVVHKVIALLLIRSGVSVNQKPAIAQAIAQGMIAVLDIMDQIAANEAPAPHRLQESHVQSGAIDSNLHDVVNIVVLDGVVSGKGCLRVLIAGDNDPAVRDVVDQVAGDGRTVREVHADTGCSVVVRAAMMHVVVRDTVSLVLIRFRRRGRKQIAEADIASAARDPAGADVTDLIALCLLYTSPSPRDS